MNSNINPFLGLCINTCMKAEKLVYDKNLYVRYVYHISDIHIRNTARYDEYNEVFERLCDILRERCSRTINESLIVITGDIMHSKTETSPESFTLGYKLLTNLCDIAPVILFDGNHDRSVANKNRMSALSPIVNNCKNLENLHYLETTGFYIYHNIMFGFTYVYDTDTPSGSNKPLSIDALDEGEFDKIQHENKYKIALYHGQISGSMTDTGYDVTTEHFKASDFRGYDFGFFGDIHKHQYLNKSKTMAYAGSLIQQNLGETLNNHGILVWDLESKLSEIVEVPNDYGYCKINVKDGKILDEIKPKHPYILFILENTTSEEFAKIKTETEEKYDICNIVFEQKIPLLTTVTNNASGELKIHNDYDTYIREYLNNKIKNPDILNKIYDIHNEMMKKNPINTDNSCYNWKILELRFSNMFSYDENNVIRFDHYNPNNIIGIVAPNYYGKSSILDIILYCLFEKTSRTVTKGDTKQIMNTRKNTMSCSLLFSIGNRKYLIERRSKRAANTKLLVDFYEISEDGNKGCIGGKKSEIQSCIEKYVGKYDDYVTSFIMTQNNDKHDNLFSKTNAGKKEYMYNILRLDLFDKYCKTSSDHKRTLINQVAVLEQQLSNIPITKTNDDINDLTLKLDTLNQKRTMILKTINYYNAILKEEPVLEKYNELKEYNINTIDDLETAKTDIQTTINLLKCNDIRANIRRNEKRISKLKKHTFDNDIATLHQEIHQLQKQLHRIPSNRATNIEDLENKRSIIEQKICLNDDELCKLIEAREVIETSPNGEINQSEYDKIIHEMHIRENFLAHVNKTLSIARKCPKEQVIDICQLQDAWISENNQWLDTNNQLLTQSKKLISNKLNSIDLITAKIDKCEMINKMLNNKLTTIEDKITNYMDIEKDIAANDKIYANINELTLRIDDITKQKIATKNEIAELKKYIRDSNRILTESTSLARKLALIDIYGLTLIKYHSDKRMYDNLLDKITRLNTKLLKTDHQITTTTLKLDTCIKIKKDYDDLSNTIMKMNDDIKLYKIYTEMVNVNGLPYEILKNILPQIECAINQILSNMVDFSIIIKTEKKSVPKLQTKRKKVTKGQKTTDIDDHPIAAKINELDFIIRRDNEESCPINFASGFEKFIIGLAIRIVLCDITASTKPNFFIIDEGWSCLDTTNMANVDNIMSYIKNHFHHTILISHIENIKTQADYFINIAKTNGFSHVNNFTQR